MELEVASDLARRAEAVVEELGAGGVSQSNATMLGCHGHADRPVLHVREITGERRHRDLDGGGDDTPLCHASGCLNQRGAFWYSLDSCGASFTFAGAVPRLLVRQCGVSSCMIPRSPPPSCVVRSPRPRRHLVSPGPSDATPSAAAPCWRRGGTPVLRSLDGHLSRGHARDVEQLGRFASSALPAGRCAIWGDADVSARWATCRAAVSTASAGLPLPAATRTRGPLHTFARTTLFVCLGWRAGKGIATPSVPLVPDLDR